MKNLGNDTSNKYPISFKENKQLFEKARALMEKAREDIKKIVKNK